MEKPDTQSLVSSIEVAQLATTIDTYPEPKEDVSILGGDVESTWKQLCNLQDFKEPRVWMAGIVELWVTGLLVFTTGAAGIALSSQTNIESPFILPMIAGLVTALVVPLFIFASLPASGGHINPLITLGSFAVRASSLPRAVIYIVGQTVGATMGAGFLRIALGDKAVVSTFIPGCTWNPDRSVSLFQAFVFESAGCIAVLWVAYAAGIDPRQGKVFGRVLGPIMIGLAVGAVIFVTGIVKPGYAGASLNPARCFGLLAATGNFENHFIHWAGTLAAAVSSGLVYLAMPPYSYNRPKTIVSTINGDFSPSRA